MPDSTTNPYLALLQQEQQPPGWAQILQHIGNLGFGLAGGFGQAASTGQPTMAGIGPGLMAGNQLNAQAAHQAEQERMKRLELQFQAQQYEDKRAEVLRKQKAMEDFAKIGFNVTPPQPQLMGPGGTPSPQGPTTGTPQSSDYNTRTAGLEGGTKKGGMVFNELGSGAGGPYQIMPATWAGIAAKYPHLNIPKVMPVDDRPETRALHDLVQNTLTAENAQGLQSGGLQPTPANLYLAHRFGAGGAQAVLRADPNKLLSEILPLDWQRQNPDMRGQTAGGFIRLAEERQKGVGVPYVVRSDAKPTQYALMPDDVPFELPGGGMTLPRPTTAQPSFTAPVMPQPTWDAPSDIARVNPGSWFPPPAAPAPGQPPPVPGQPGQPGQPPPAPGPGGVPVQYAPGPNTPPMAPGGSGPAPAPAPAPASGGVPGIEPPPVKPVAPMPQPDPTFAAQQRAALLGNLIKPDEYLNNMRQHVMDRHTQLQAQIDAQFQPQMKAWEARNQLSLEQYKIAEARADEQRRRREKGAFIRDPNNPSVQTWITEAEMQSGMTQADKPPEPPAPGTQAGDDHILSTAPKDSVEYRDAFNRQAREPKVINGQAYVRDMSKVPPPTYGQPAGAPAPAAAPAPAPAAKSDIPGMTPVGGGVSSTEMANLRIARTEAETLVKALEDFKQEFKKAGTMDSALSLGGSNTPLNTSYNVAALLAKGDQLFKLGVLSGPDLDIIRRTLPDPSTFRGAMTKTADMEAAVDKVTGLIEAKLRAHEKNLGVEPANIRPAPATQSMQPKSDPLEGRTATGPNGQKVIRRNGQWEPVP